MVLRDEIDERLFTETYPHDLHDYHDIYDLPDSRVAEVGSRCICQFSRQKCHFLQQNIVFWRFQGTLLPDCLNFWYSVTLLFIHCIGADQRSKIGPAFSSSRTTFCCKNFNEFSPKALSLLLKSPRKHDAIY